MAGFISDYWANKLLGLTFGTTAVTAPATLYCALFNVIPLSNGTGGTEAPWAVGATARRWGGNPTTRYNWQLGTWNLTKDWFYKNVGEPEGTRGWETFLDENREHGVKTALPVPTIGWVAKDATSWGFPASEFGQQQAMAPDNPAAGNGVGRDNKELAPGPPTQTSMRSTPLGRPTTSSPGSGRPSNQSAAWPRSTARLMSAMATTPP